MLTLGVIKCLHSANSLLYALSQFWLFSMERILLTFMFMDTLFTGEWWFASDMNWAGGDGKKTVPLGFWFLMRFFDAHSLPQQKRGKWLGVRLKNS